MLRIRLRRTGAKKKPNYRLVIADARAPRDGAFLDIVGYYNPLTEPSTVVIDTAKAQKWLSHGAQPSDRVARLFKREGIGATAGAAPATEAAAPPAEPAADTAAKTPRTRRASAAAGEAPAAPAAKAAAKEPSEAPRCRPWP
jgi:small subunit ribosomal protein S16